MAAMMIPIGATAGQIQSHPLTPAKNRKAEVGRARHQRVQRGVASWYGPGCQGRQTANGETFDEHKLTAANRTLPLGSRVRVTNLRNGRSVVVRINDRGPWVYTRLIDLSKAAAERLGFRSYGLTPVKITVLRETARREALSQTGDPASDAMTSGD